MPPMVLGILLVVLCSSPGPVEAGRILALFPHVGKSHYIFVEPLLKALAVRGHQVTVISPFPQTKPISGFTDIDVSQALSVAYVNSVPLEEFGTINPTSTINLVFPLGVFTCEKVLAHPEVQTLIHSEEHKFDLVMYETFNTDCFLGFAHKFKVPIVGIFSGPMVPWASERIGNPDHPAYTPNLLTPFSANMNFIQRTVNFLYYIVSRIVYKISSDIPSYKIAKQYFGENLPPLADIAANTSLLLINSHYSFFQARPFVPAVVEVSGLHIQPPGNLPPDLKQFLDEAKHGVIYFSLGSTLRASTMPKHMLETLLAAFSELPQRVLWKWEDDTMPGKPENVKIAKWLPQMAVLAHPNVKVFLNHGGLMGTIEAVYNAVPMVSIPMFGDQFHNVAMCMSKGIALKLTYNEITKENILKVLKEILYESKYRENAKIVSEVYHDRPQSALDTAVYWTEYIIRHRGAPHLRSAALELNLAQYLLLDVVAVLLAPIVLFLAVLFFAMRLVFRRIFGYKQHAIKHTKKQKSQ